MSGEHFRSPGLHPASSFQAGNTFSWATVMDVRREGLRWPCRTTVCVCVGRGEGMVLGACCCCIWTYFQVSNTGDWENSNQRGGKFYVAEKTMKFTFTLDIGSPQEPGGPKGVSPSLHVLHCHVAAFHVCLVSHLPRPHPPGPVWWSLRQPLEKTMAPHSSTLAWKIPWMEEPGGLQSMGSLRVGHDWATSVWLFTFMHWRRKWQPTPVFLPGESHGQRSLVGCRLWGRTELDTTEVT